MAARVINPGLFEGIRAPKSAKALMYADLDVPLRAARQSSVKVNALPGRSVPVVPMLNLTNAYFPAREVLPRKPVLGLTRSVNGTTSNVMGIKPAGFMTRGENLNKKDLAYDRRFLPKPLMTPRNNFGPIIKK